MWKHWLYTFKWKNCLVALKGNYVWGDHGKIIVMLEALQNLWIWHAIFGVSYSNNDINVLNQSIIFNDVMQGRAHEIHYTINHIEYKMDYHLLGDTKCAIFSQYHKGIRENRLTNTKKDKKWCWTSIWSSLIPIWNNI